MDAGVNQGLEPCPPRIFWSSNEFPVFVQPSDIKNEILNFRRGTGDDLDNVSFNKTVPYRIIVISAPLDGLAEALDSDAATGD